MTIFDGFDDFSYFNRLTTLVGVVLFIFFLYLTDSIYQSAVLAMSVLLIHYKYIEDKNKMMEDDVFINNYGDKINALDDIKLDKYQKDAIDKSFPKSKYIHDYDNKEFKNFLFLNQEFYYYNQQNFIEMVKCIDKFLEIYEEVRIDIKRSGKNYSKMKMLRDESIEMLNAIKINCPDDRNVLNKINNAVKDLETLMDKYLYDVKIKNDINIKLNGYNNQTVLITQTF